MMMTRWFTALLLATGCAHGALAQERDRLVLFGEDIQNDLGRIILDRDACASYALSASTDERCAGGRPSLRGHRQLTDLDRFVLFADKYANARFKREISDGAELKFRADVPDVLRTQADFKVQLDIDF